MTTETVAAAEEIRGLPGAYAVGDRVEVWFDGWNTWQPGTVEQVGRLDGRDCVAVRLGQTAWASVYPVGRVRHFNPATADLQTARQPLGGLFGGDGSEERGETECESK